MQTVLWMWNIHISESRVQIRVWPIDGWKTVTRIEYWPLKNVACKMGLTCETFLADSKNTIFTAVRRIFAEIPVHLFWAVTSSPALLQDISAGQCIVNGTVPIFVGAILRRWPFGCLGFLYATSRPHYLQIPHLLWHCAPSYQAKRGHQMTHLEKLQSILWRWNSHYGAWGNNFSDAIVVIVPVALGPPNAVWFMVAWPLKGHSTRWICWDFRFCTKPWAGWKNASSFAAEMIQKIRRISTWYPVPFFWVPGADVRQKCRWWRHSPEEMHRNLSEYASDSGENGIFGISEECFTSQAHFTSNIFQRSVLYYSR